MGSTINFQTKTIINYQILIKETEELIVSLRSDLIKNANFEDIENIEDLKLYLIILKEQLKQEKQNYLELTNNNLNNIKLVKKQKPVVRILTNYKYLSS